MKINTLILSEAEIIPPNDDMESQEDERWDAIHAMEQAVAQKNFIIYQQAGISMNDLDGEDGSPVLVSFDERDGTVEIIVTSTDNISMQSLIALSEANAITPRSEIRTDGVSMDIVTVFPAAETPFRKFMRA